MSRAEYRTRSLVLLLGCPTSNSTNFFFKRQKYLSRSNKERQPRGKVSESRRSDGRGPNRFCCFLPCNQLVPFLFLLHVAPCTLPIWPTTLFPAHHPLTRPTKSTHWPFHRFNQHLDTMFFHCPAPYCILFMLVKILWAYNMWQKYDFENQPFSLLILL